MTVSFSSPPPPPPPPSSKRPFQSGKIFQHFEGPFFEVALVSLLGLVNCFSITEEDSDETMRTLECLSSAGTNYMGLAVRLCESLFHFCQYDHWFCHPAQKYDSH